MLEGLERIEPGRDAAVPPIPLGDLPALPDRARRLRGQARPSPRATSSICGTPPCSCAGARWSGSSGWCAATSTPRSCATPSASSRSTWVSRRSTRPAIYSLLPYTEIAGGLYFPMGGMHAIPRALARLAEELGVRDRIRRRRASAGAGDGRVPRGPSGRRVAGGGRPRAGQRRPAVRVRDAAGPAVPPDRPLRLQLLGVPHVPRRGPAISRAAAPHPGGAARSADHLRGHLRRPRFPPTRRTTSATRARPTRRWRPPGCGEPLRAGAGAEPDAGPRDRLVGGGAPARGRHARAARAVRAHRHAAAYRHPPELHAGRLRHEFSATRGEAFGLAHGIDQVGWFRPHNRHRTSRTCTSWARAPTPAAACRWCSSRPGWSPSGSPRSRR